METYIKQAAVFKKLDTAKQNKQNIYIYGATGYGKTELVKQYFSSRNYIYIQCSQNECDLSAARNNTRNFPVVIDNINAIENEMIRNEITELCSQSRFWVIISGRSRMPGWLFDTFVNQHMALITEEDLMFSEDDIDRYMKNLGITLDSDEITFLKTAGRGNIFAISYTAQRLLAGDKTGKKLAEECETLFKNHIETNIISEFSSELRDFLLRISIADEFNAELASVITGDSSVQRLIDSAMDKGNFMTVQNGVYTIIPHMLGALRSKAAKEIPQNELSSLSLVAGRYYESQGNDDKALDLYARYNASEHIRGLLIKNSRKNPESGHFVEMRRYYLMLSDDDIRSNIYLMSAMSMLHSMLMDFEKSEYWYGELRNTRNSSSGTEKKEAACLLAYLDVALPGRGSINILQLIKDSYTILTEKSVSLPEFSVTSNLPSIMNGGKDFCEWSKNDKKIAATAGSLISAFLGKYGRGLVNAALAESFFEKGGNPYDIMSRVSRARMEAEAGGKTELSFAAAGTLFRQYIILGESDNAAMLLDSVESRAEKEQVKKLRNSIDAMRCRLSLLAGDTRAAEQWLETAPDENAEFVALYRYLYLTKIRCYIALEQYDKAHLLIESLKYYAEKCDRKMLLMELGILSSVIMFRTDREWKSEFESTLELICEYRFIPTVIEHGAAVYELLKKCDGIYETNPKIDADWFEKVLRKCGKVARYYPLYLKTEKKVIKELQPIDIHILSCLADGLSIQATADKMNINYETLRSRIKEIYRKMGAKNKTEAVMTAQKLDII